MEQRCELTGRIFTVSEAEQNYCRQNGLPLPRQHPVERIRHLFTFRNRIHLYNSTCALSGVKMFSCIPPAAKRVVYDVDAWESDRWEARNYGRDYDFSRPFFEQYRELLETTPIPNLAVIRSTMENSDYTNGITGAKNCYLLFAAAYNEECLFSSNVNHSTNVVDCTHVEHCELCYSSTHLFRCYNLRYSENCNNCSDGAFLSSCNSCRNCFGCVNLFNREYHFFNEKLSREEYLRRIAEIDMGSAAVVEQYTARFAEFKESFPVKYTTGTFNENSSGDYLNQTRRCTNCYFVTEAEDVEWSVWLLRSKSSFFFAAYGLGSELIYSSVACGDNAYNLKFCVDCWPGARDLEYCMFTGYGSSNCFGCVSLKKASYCILNKQYSKGEFLELVARIKKQMHQTGEYGQFFPGSLSHFYYNQSDADAFMPASKELVTGLGYRWEDRTSDKLIDPLPLPDNIREATDEVLQRQYSCARTKKAYRITKQELDFYRRQGVPLPRVAPLERVIERSRAVAIRELTSSSCRHCHKPLQTPFGNHPGGVLCEGCYQQAAS